MTGLILYSTATILVSVSFFKNQAKTKQALIKAWKGFSKLIPQVLVIMILVGVSLALLTPEMISTLIGDESGIFGVAFSLIIGSITLIPSFIVFPLGGVLLENGAGYPQVAAFVSSVMAVGIMTLPVETQYFGKSVAIWRNMSALLISILFTFVIWVVMVV
ncbi:hypothetical protein [Melghirimyces algeriensis]|uniref:Permease n=1 Tax=Melghirimyces algeriensis TaxID=910412 RepID=A0A521BGY3_9BACL|nr:hypothetical protein [Melghirimyces algeriensis]SMO45980.1 hypothetical protein SAMN06264849_10264 [Melghirimyces algeriensis]